MLRPKHFSFCFLIIAGCTLFSCSPKYRLSTYFVPEKMVPADFDPNKQVLLIVEFPKKDQPDTRHVGYTNKMEKILQKYYPYKYEIVSRRDAMENYTRYGDTVKYKYAVLDFMGNRKITTTTTVKNTDITGHKTTTKVSPSVIMYTNSFHFYDRNSGNNYPGSPMASTNLGQAFSEFIKMTAKGR